MGVNPSDEQMDEIMDMATALGANPTEVSSYIKKMVAGPTKKEMEEAQRKAKAKVEAEEKAREERRAIIRAEEEERAKKDSRNKWIITISAWLLFLIYIILLIIGVFRFDEKVNTYIYLTVSALIVPIVVTFAPIKKHYMKVIIVFGVFLPFILLLSIFPSEWMLWEVIYVPIMVLCAYKGIE